MTPNPQGMAQSDLRRVTQAARKLGSARAAFVETIIAARESGESLRDIGRAAGVSHARIAQIVRQHKES